MPGTWVNLLNWETAAKQQINLEKNFVEDKPTIFDKFVPNPKGQTEFLELMKWKSTEDLDLRYCALIGGIGSGKTTLGAVWAVSRALLSHESKGLICANTFGQLSRSTLIGLVRICREFNIPLEPFRESVEDNALAIANCQRCYIGEKKAFVFVLSVSSFSGATQAGRGLEVRWFWGDELAYAPESALKVIDGRLGRGEGKLKGQGVISTSPAGFNHIYTLFADPNRDEKTKQLYRMIKVSSRENAEHLGEDYLSSLETNYTDELARQELYGDFIATLQGLIYKYFDRRVHCLRDEDAEILEYDSNLPLMLSFDFNYSPAICVAAQQRQNEIHFFKEWYILDSDLWELTESVTDWIIENGDPASLLIFGDATGHARSANSRLSSWDIVTEQLKPITKYKPQGYLIKKFAKSNPHVINRIHSVNLLFKQNRCFLDFVECPNLIKDFEQVTYTPDRAIAKENALLSHLSDAAGYLIHSLYPFKREGHREKLGTKKPAGVAS